LRRQRAIASGAELFDRCRRERTQHANSTQDLDAAGMGPHRERPPGRSRQSSCLVRALSTTHPSRTTSARPDSTMSKRSTRSACSNMRVSVLQRTTYLTAVTGYPAGSAAGEEVVTARLNADAERRP
jgi:hypothetical protein